MWLSFFVFVLSCVATMKRLLRRTLVRPVMLCSKNYFIHVSVEISSSSFAV
jgi:hypothetical protein